MRFSIHLCQGSTQGHTKCPIHCNIRGLNTSVLQERAEIRSLASQETYIAEQDKPQKLSILVSGKMLVYKTDDWSRRDVILPVFQDDSNKDHVELIVGEVDAFEFVDSCVPPCPSPSLFPLLLS